MCSPAWPTATWVLTAALLAACASLDAPQAWSGSAQKALPNGCPDLSGSYSTGASEAYPAYEGAFPLLNDILGPGVLRDAQAAERPWPTSSGAATGSFRSQGEWLYVEFPKRTEGEAALRFKRKDWWGGSVDGSHAMYQCMELELGPALGFDGPRSTLFSVPNLVAQSDYGFVFLSKAADGALIVNFRTDRVLFTGILIGSHARWANSVWWRYPAAVPGR